LNDTLFNQNPDIVVPYPQLDLGVEGGHFDVEIYHSTQAATATITVGTTGQTAGFPATLGAISVAGVTIVPALTVTDITNGMASGLNAKVIADKVTGGFTATRTGHVITIKAPPGVNYYGAAISIADGTSGALSTNFKPALVVTPFTSATDATVAGNTCGDAGLCKPSSHRHEYDDIYNRTGVNFLNASDPRFNLSVAVPSMTTEFKVIGQNQYLSPAARLHIGNSGYLFNVNLGYIDYKNFQTSATLDLANVPTYTRATIGSLAINLPSDAFSTKDWWGSLNGLEVDERDGLHPTLYNCVIRSDQETNGDGNMYQPVIPPSTVTPTGNGTKGWSLDTTQLTATGVRHNGALTLQIIKANTPNSAIEQSVPGRPEYGYRVKAGDFATYVIAEYTMFHHTKHLTACYGDTGWTKTPAQDTRTCGATDSTTTKKCAVELSAGAGTDPLIGDLSGGGGAVQSATTTVVGAVTTTTITYLDLRTATITRTANEDGSVTIVTVDADGNTTTQTIANKAGAVKTGGDERGLQARTGRISWRELVEP
jgi:hypothetical protein